MFYKLSMKMRLCWHVFALAVVFFGTPSVAQQLPDRVSRDPQTLQPLIFASNEAKQEESDINTFALISGKCSKLNVAGRDFPCKAVAFFYSQQGRANFAVALDDPTDDSHVVSFSGENGRREQDNLFELPVDRMLLNSKDRPKVDGLPVPVVELSTGMCKQVGNFATRQISSIACSATDKNGKKYELQFESDGSPITLRRIRQTPLSAEKRSPRQIERRECRNKADAAKVLPRDWTAYMLRCLAENSQDQ
jgi:hypothetical protein